jgi:hypothetical protein
VTIASRSAPQEYANTPVGAAKGARGSRKRALQILSMQVQERRRRTLRMYCSIRTLRIYQRRSFTVQRLGRPGIRNAAFASA